MGLSFSLWIAACLHRAPEPVADPLAASVRAADARFAQRGTDPEALTDAMDGWLGRIAEAPDDRAALARLAHGEWLLSMADPTQAAMHLANGEEYGWRCLLAEPGFAASVDAAGGRVSAESVARLPPDSAPCVAWTAANGLDRALLRGAGAALGARDLGALAQRARTWESDAALVPWSSAGLPGLGAWLEARWRTLSEDSEAARAAYIDAVRAGPGVRRWRTDAARAFPGSADALPPDPREDAWAYENRLVTGD